jgi:hypothetical protein
MIKTKIAQKKKEKAFLAFSVISLSLLLVGSIFAQTVLQKIGFKDVKFSSLSKELCQECHMGSLVDTHHNTSNAVSGNCVFCHKVQTQAGNVGVLLDRNCMTCHTESPHHATEAAKNKECRACHDSAGLSDYSLEVPTYAPSRITPTPGNCNLCHGEGIVDGQEVFASRDTHHDIGFKECNVCHDETEQEQSDGITNIRVCERCHNVKVLHEVQPHLEKQSCVVCHGGKTVAAQPEVEEQTQPEAEEQTQPEVEE